MLRGTCPCCAAVFEYDATIQHDYGRKAIIAAMQLPPALAARCFRYLRLFISPGAPQSRLNNDRAATLLDALVQAITAASVHVKGRDWAAPLTLWPEAMDAVFAAVADNRRKLPLTNHAYLFGCIANMADAAEAQQEGATEAQRKNGRVFSAGAHTAFDVEPVPPRADAALDDLSTSKKIGEQPAPNGDADEKLPREVPDFVKAAFAQLIGNKSIPLVTAQQAALDAPADPLIGQLAGISKGKWKGKGGTIVRVAGDQVYVAIQFPRNGLQTIAFNRSELSL
jgi:hypothetical protein